MEHFHGRTTRHTHWHDRTAAWRILPKHHDAPSLKSARLAAPDRHSLIDLALIKAIARGRQWADDLLTGRVESVAAIAQRQGVLPNYVRRLTRLAFLAPRIVEAIVAGHQPPELTAKALTERIELPLLWSEQERAVGID